MKNSICILLIALGMSLVAKGQDENGRFSEEKKLAKTIKKNQKDSVRTFNLDQGKSMFFPFVAPGYSPELGAQLAVGGLWSFKTNKADSVIQRSSIPMSFAVTTRGATVAMVRPTTFWFNDKLRINAELWFKNMPDHYWGVGFDNAKNVEKGLETTAYKRKWFSINPQFLYQFHKNYFVGLNVDYNYTKGGYASKGVAEDPNYLKYNNSPLNSGFGIVLRHDSRDILVNAWKGAYVDLEATFYDNAFGGDNTYQMYLVDYRQYVQVAREGQTMTWQVKGRFGVGDVPYGEMGQLGNPFDFRGYTWGRFRDQNLFFVLPEYRHSFYKKDGSKSKHGVVAWAGVGTVFGSENLENQSKRNWLGSFGVGYRYELIPRMNIRFDVGFAEDRVAVYFNFSEAF